MLKEEGAEDFVQYDITFIKLRTSTPNTVWFGDVDIDDKTFNKHKIHYYFECGEAGKEHTGITSNTESLGF